jgi:putative ABC transport system ATP-binding protein
VFQKVLLLPMLRALDNVMVPLRLDGVSVEEATKRAQDALKSVDMLHKSSSRPGELSGGEAQRVAIARAMVINPAIILADEPTGALDSQNSKNIIELFRDLVTRSQQTLIVVTHDPSVAAAADRTVRMKDGEIIEDQRNAKVAV